MKPKNFPARKLKRQMIANSDNINSIINKEKLETARSIRTKKYRGKNET